MSQIIALLLCLLLAGPAQADFTIPNVADAFNAAQAQVDKVDFDILAAGIDGTGVYQGAAVTAQGTPDMTLAVAAGTVHVGNTTCDVAAGNVTIPTAHATNPRFDLVVVNNSCTKSVTAGTAAASPVFPSIPANSVVLAAIYVPANDTAIASNQIADKRVLQRTPWTYTLASQHSISSTTATEIPGLQASGLTAGTYLARYNLIVRSATGTVGLGYGINYTGTVTKMSCVLQFPTSGGTAANGTADDVGANGQLWESWPARTEATATPNLGPYTGGVTTTAADITNVIECVLVVSDSGDLEIWHGSETATATSVETGSVLVLTKTSD